MKLWGSKNQLIGALFLGLANIFSFIMNSYHWRFVIMSTNENLGINCFLFARVGHYNSARRCRDVWFKLQSLSRDH